MRWFFIWIMFLPLCLNGQSGLNIKVNDKVGCNCGDIDTTTFKIRQAEETVSSGEVSDTLAACYFHCIGIQYYEKDNCPQAIQFNKKALTLREQFHKEFVWKSHYTLGMAYNHLAMYAKSQSALQTAHNTWGIKRQKDTLEMFRIMANNLSKMGELRQAEDYAIQTTQIKTDELWRTADAFNNLADILASREEQSDDNKKRAIEYADTAIQLYREAGEDEYYIAHALNIKANALSWLGYYDEAINTYDLVLNIYGENSEEYAETLNNKGSDLGKKGNYKAAIKTLTESLEIKKNTFNKAIAYTYAPNHENLAENYEALGDIDKALKHYQLALQNLTNNFRQKDIHQNPIPSDSLYVYNKVALIFVLHRKASAAFKQYQQEGDAVYLTLAEKTYNTAFGFHDELRQQVTTQESRLFHAKTIAPFIENALSIAYELQQTQQQTPETAFRFMEKNKATVLMQAINEKGALQYAGLPDSLLQQEKELRENITAYEKQLNDARQYEEKQTIKQYETLLFEQKNTYDQLVRNLEQNHPEYYNLKYKQSTTTLKDAQNYLDNETALLEYFVGDSSVYVLVIEKNTAHLHRLDKSENWNKTLNDFRAFISEDSTQLSFAPNARQLYELLLEKPLNNLNTNTKRLQIIPDAQLNYLPFGLLLTQAAPTNPNYQNLPYLLKDKSIGYAYSTTLLLENQQQNRSRTPYVYGGFAPKYNDDDLPNGREKVQQQTQKTKGKSFLADQATKAQFQEHADQFQILQLSMHGILNDEKPLYSKLIFANNEPLYAADLYNARLNADLAILSACNTGTGEIKKGEGVMSLSRAFTYAGCPSLLMSLWSVPDASTATIMDTFLEQLQQGKTKDKALQNAQLTYLDKASPDKLHPAHWAGFVPSGDMQAVDFSHTSSWWWLAILILLVALYLGKRAS